MKGIASAEKMGLKPMRLRGGQVHLAYVVYKTARHPGSVLAPVAARLHPPPPCAAPCRHHALPCIGCARIAGTLIPSRPT